MKFPLFENVRVFVWSRPPIVVAVVFLGYIAAGLISFACIFRGLGMSNPNVPEDWNTFLEHISGLSYCLTGDAGGAMSDVWQTPPGYSDQLKQTGHSVHMEVDRKEQGSMVVITSTAPTPPSSSRMNVSLVMDLDLVATASLQHVAARHNYTYVTTTVLGSQLGRTGHRASLEANMTFVLPPLGNHSCLHHGGGPCHVSACVTLSAPPHFFPRTQKPGMDETCVRDQELGGENHFHVEVVPNYVRCINGSFFNLQHSYDPTLTSVTTMQDRSTMNLHLLHTSYFLFIMVITLFCCAIVKGRPNKVKVAYTHCPSDKHATNQV